MKNGLVATWGSGWFGISVAINESLERACGNAVVKYPYCDDDERSYTCDQFSELHTYSHMHTHREMHDWQSLNSVEYINVNFLVNFSYLEGKILSCTLLVSFDWSNN